MDTISNLFPGDSCTVEHYVYSGGDQGVTMELYKVLNGGHAWPTIDDTGGLNSPTTSIALTVGNRNRDFNASEVIWNFLSKKSLTTDIEKESNSQSETHLFPNPSGGTFTLQVNDFLNASLTIFNSLGENVYKSELTSNSNQINIETLPAGVYFYQVVNKTTTSTGKIIVE